MSLNEQKLKKRDFFFSCNHNDLLLFKKLVNLFRFDFSAGNNQFPSNQYPMSGPPGQYWYGQQPYGNSYDYSSGYGGYGSYGSYGTGATGFGAYGYFGGYPPYGSGYGGYGGGENLLMLAN